MATKKYINLNNLSTFLTVLRETFSEIGHKHSISDITDYVVDAELSATSNNPVQNNVINAEFEAVSKAMNALDLAIDGKSDSAHTHDDRYYTESEIDSKLSEKSDSNHNHDDDYLTKEDPSATGSFSLNRKESTSIGTYSVAEGRNNTASGLASHAEGDGTTASAQATHAEGSGTTASSWYAHAEGCDTTASARAAHAEGNTTVAKGQQSHAEGFYTVAASTSQHVQGKHNIEDANNVYAHIVGNGSSDAKSNAHTLDWSGNAWYAGTIKVGGTSYEDAVEVALKSDIPEMPDIPEIPEIIPMSKGGTGATDGATGLANLFAAGNTVLSSYQYGAELPANPAVGQLYFEEATGTIADIGQDVAKALRAVNLLVNSYFRNPVNQRGQTSYSSGGYCIDRWLISASQTLSVDDGVIRVTPEKNGVNFYQVVANGEKLGGKTVTFAAKGSGDFNFVIYYLLDGVEHNIVVEGHAGDTTAVVCGNFVIPENVTNVETSIQSASTTAYALEWVALYEGEYTVETLPPYVPKDFEVERLSCNGGCSNSFKAMLPVSGWGSEVPYTQTIQVDGLLSTDEPFVDIDLSGGFGQVSDLLYVMENYYKVGRFTVSADNTLTAYCYEEKPTSGIPIMLKVVR